MDDTTYLPRDHVPTASRPLLGMTVLVVEDSRYASEAVRLMCVRSGARIRRADCLASARRHLRVYRPTVLIVDVGLPDGSGLDLVSEMDRAAARVDVILASSGDEGWENAALDAGADGFLAKPIRKLAQFQSAILGLVPPDRRPAGPRPVDPTEVEPDVLAYRDDMASVAQALDGGLDDQTMGYVTQFLRGVARAARDEPLLDAVNALREDRQRGDEGQAGVARIAGLVQDRAAQNIPI